MFAHPLTSFCTHLEASNSHIAKNQKINVLYPEILNSRIFPYFLYRGAIGVEPVESAVSFQLMLSVWGFTPMECQADSPKSSKL